MEARSLGLFTTAFEDATEVGTIGGLTEGFERMLEGDLIQEAHLQTDFLEAGDAETLSILDGADEVCRLQ